MTAQLSCDYVVYSGKGRPVTSFTCPVLCARWLHERRDTGVRYEVWQVVRTATEVAPGHLDGWVDGTLGLLEPPPPAPEYQPPCGSRSDCGT